MDCAPRHHVSEFIRAQLPLVPVPSIPEILLHKAGPKSGLRRLAEADENFSAPYWAHYWGGGLALARHVLNHPMLVSGRSVLDLGTGSGIVGIAAAKAGARHVLAADTDPYAIAAAEVNAAANEVAIITLCADPTTQPPPPYIDVILVGDLFYEEDLSMRLTAFLDNCLRANIEILVGDPWRAFLPRARLRLLAEYQGLDFGLGEPTENAVFAFTG